MGERAQTARLPIGGEREAVIGRERSGWRRCGLPCRRRLRRRDRAEQHVGQAEPIAGHRRLRDRIGEQRIDDIAAGAAGHGEGLPVAIPHHPLQQQCAELFGHRLGHRRVVPARLERGDGFGVGNEGQSFGSPEIHLKAP